MYRSANRTTHNLAQYVLNGSPKLIWTENFSMWLEDIVLEDLKMNAYLFQKKSYDSIL